MALREDNRLQDAPMRPVRCGRCAARVTVRKSSWPQTSIQWDAAARAACEELREAGTGSEDERLRTCHALRESIAHAAQDGSVPVPDDGY
jgi:hypothetical protein